MANARCIQKLMEKETFSDPSKIISRLISVAFIITYSQEPLHVELQKRQFVKMHFRDGNEGDNTEKVAFHS